SLHPGRNEESYLTGALDARTGRLIWLHGLPKTSLGHAGVSRAGSPVRSRSALVFLCRRVRAPPSSAVAHADGSRTSHQQNDSVGTAARSSPPEFAYRTLTMPTGIRTAGA